MACFNRSTNHISKGISGKVKDLTVSLRKTATITSSQTSPDTLPTAGIPRIHFANNLGIPILSAGLKKKTRTARNRHLVT